MKVIKIFLCLFISIFMVLDLLVLQISMFTHDKLYNSNYYIERFRTLQLYSFIDDALSKDLGNIQKECNLPKDMFDNLFNKSSIENEVNNYTTNTINYMTYKSSNLQDSNIRSYTDKFNSRLDNFLVASNVRLDNSTKADINNIRTQTDSTIKNEIHIVNFSDLVSSPSFQKIRSYMYKIYSFQTIFVGIFILLTLILFILEMRKIFMFVVWFSSALIASGLTVLIIVEVFLHTNILSNLMFSSAKLQLIISSVLNGYLQSMLNLSIYITIAGVVLFIGNVILDYVKVSNYEV